MYHLKRQLLCFRQPLADGLKAHPTKARSVLEAMVGATTASTIRVKTNASARNKIQMMQTSHCELPNAAAAQLMSCHKQNNNILEPARS